MEKGRPKKDNVKDSSIARRLQRQNKKDGVLVKVGRKTICEKVKEELKKNGIEGVKKLMDSKKVSKLGLKKCVKEGKLDKELLDKLGIKMNKSSVAKKAVKKVLAKKAPVKKEPKKDKDEKPRGSKGGGGGGGGGESQSKVQAPVPAEKLVQQIAPSQEPLNAMEFLNRRRMEMGDSRLKPITDSELARARVLVAEQQKKEFGKSFPEGDEDPHAKPPGFKTQNPLNTHNNVAGITSTNASIQNQVDKDFEEFTRKLREETKKEAQSNLDSLLSNVDEAVARGFEKSELKLDAPVLGNFVLQSEPTQQSTLQQQSGFNQGNLSQPKTIAETQLEQDQARVARNYEQFDHSVLSQYASGNPTQVDAELASNQDEELEEEEFDEESDEESDEEAPSPISGRMMGLFV